MVGALESGANNSEHSNFRVAHSTSQNFRDYSQIPLVNFELPQIDEQSPKINGFEYTQLPLRGLEGPQTRPIPDIDIASLRLPVEGQTLKDQLPFPLLDPAIRGILLENGADKDKVNQVFNENGEWVLYGTDDIPELYSLPVLDLKQKLTEKFSKVYDLVDYRLRADKYPHGYNGHDMQHINPVVENTEKLLRMAGKTEDEVRLGVIAAMIHDLGNISRRSGHSLDSTAIALAVAPSLLQNPDEFEKISTAAKLHDEKALKRDLGINGAGTAKRDVARIKEIGPILAALVIADKVDIGRHRTNQWATNPEVLNGDDHAFLNFFGETHGFTLEDTKEGKELIWHVNYRPDVAKDEYERFAALARESANHDDYAALVPKWVQDAYRQGRTSHFKEWAQTTFRTYEDRIKLSAKCAMALFDIDYFTVELHDPVKNSSRKAGTRHIETFDRTLLNEHERKFDLMYVPYDKRRWRVVNNGDTQTEVVLFAPNQTQGS